MKDYKAYFKSKKITVMGLGLLGRGVGDVIFLAECGAELIVTDLKAEEELKPSLDQLKKYDIKYTLGKHDLKDFQNCDLVIKAAGVPLDSPFIAEARKNNIPVKMSTALFAEFSPATIVGVTGTRGKSTVSAMIFEILKTAGRKTFLGGNTKGISTLAHLREGTADEIVVLELDSWQLQGFGEMKMSPHVSVFTTFYPDHLNYYKNDRNAYLEDKSQIFAFQNKKDFLVLGEQCADLIKAKYRNIKSEVTIAHFGDIPYTLKIPGEHNLYNAACARKAAKALEIEEVIIQRALEQFRGVEGRLELVRQIGGVEIYNDTTATTPEATIEALRALAPRQSSGQNQNYVLILGGSDKGLDMNVLLKEIPQYCKALILLPGTGTQKLDPGPWTLTPIVKVRTLKEAVQKAINLAKDGDTILFSPAFASFGMFKNEFDRGDQFNKLVNSL